MPGEMPEDKMDLEMLEVYQDLRYEGQKWLCKVGVRLAGRVREGLGWGETPEEAKRRAIQETLSLAPEGKELLEAIEKALASPHLASPQTQGERERKGEGKEVSPEAPSSPIPTSSPEEASVKTEGKNGSSLPAGEAMEKAVMALKQRFPEAYYMALEELKMGERELRALVSLIERGEGGGGALEKARKIYGAFREIYKDLASREEKPPRKELVVLVRKIVDRRFGEERSG